MAEVVPEPDRLGQVLVQPQRPGDGAGDPARFEGVGEAGAVVVALRGDEDLGLVLEPPKGLRMDDPVAVALKRRSHRAVLLGLGAIGGVGGRRALPEVGAFPLPHPLLQRPRAGALRGGGHR